MNLPWSTLFGISMRQTIVIDNHDCHAAKNVSDIGISLMVLND